MATGISKTKWTGKAPSPRTGQYAGAPGALDVALTYEGKRAESDITRTQPATLQALGTEMAGAENWLYFGDNLPILAALLRDPAVRGHVRLVYIDPPFATRSVFQSRGQRDAYADLLAGAHYLEFLRARLILLRELLADDGAIYVHLDDNMAFYVKVIMDEVFGPSRFRNWITRQKCNPKNYTRKAYGNVADYILFYTKSDTYVWNRPADLWSEDHPPKEYRYVEERTGRRYMKVPIHAPGVRGGETGKPWRGMNPPPGKHWQFPPATLDAMDARGEIYWSPNGNPRRKVYLDANQGVSVQDVWLGFKDAHNQNVHITGYPTEKNPGLLARIVATSSNPGDLVLDCFSGSGTTLAVAAELGRRWIGVDNSPEAIETTLRRFATGVERMGDYVEARVTPTGDRMSSTRLEAVYLFPPDPPVTIQSQLTDLDPYQGSDRLQEQPGSPFGVAAALPYEGELDAIMARWYPAMPAAKAVDVKPVRRKPAPQKRASPAS